MAKKKIEKNNIIPNFLSNDKDSIISSIITDFAYSYKVEPTGVLVFQWGTDSLAKIIGYTLKELIKNGGWEKIIYPDDMHIPLGQLDTLLNGKSKVVEYRILTKDKNIKWISDYAHAVWSKEEKRTVFIYGDLHDITDRKKAEEALKSSEQRFRDLITEINEGFFITDLKGRFLFVNKAFAQIHGYDNPEELTKMGVLDFIIPEKREFAKNIFKNQVSKDTELDEVEIEIIRKDGDKRVIYVRPVKIYEDNKLVGVRGVIIDITDKKRSEKIILSQRDLGLALNRTADFNETLKTCLDKAIEISDMDCGGIYLTDNDGGLILAYHTGLSDDFIKITSNYDKNRDNVKLVMNNKPIYSSYKEIGLQYNKIAVVEGLKAMAVIPIDYENKVIGCLNIASHKHEEVPGYSRITIEAITAYIGVAIVRAKITDSLKESEERYRELIDNINEGFYITDLEGTLTFVNKGLADIFGYDEPKDMMGKHFSEYVEPNAIDIVNGKFKEAVETGEFKKYYEIPIFKKDKGIGYVKMRATGILKDGKLIGIRGIMSEITEEKRHQKEREQLTAELTEKNKELEEVLYIASHDLRTPLVNIKGFCNELFYSAENLMEIFKDIDKNIDQEKINNIISDEIPESIDYIKKSLFKMDFLISGILRLSRLGKADMDLEEIDTNKLISDIINTFEYQLTSRNIKVNVTELMPCKGDSILLNQVFSNLIDNAIKYFDPHKDGLIKIDSYKDNNYIVFTIEDNGIGITDNNKERIFEIFHRINPDNSAGEGLGLNIVKKIVSKHKGNVWLESQEGKGSKFYIELPVN